MIYKQIIYAHTGPWLVAAWQHNHALRFIREPSCFLDVFLGGRTGARLLTSSGNVYSNTAQTDRTLFSQGRTGRTNRVQRVDSSGGYRTEKVFFMSSFDVPYEEGQASSVDVMRLVEAVHWFSV